MLWEIMTLWTVVLTKYQLITGENISDGHFYFYKKNSYDHGCNWKVKLNCGSQLIDITTINISKQQGCTGGSSQCPCNDTTSRGIPSDINIETTIRSACNSKQTCNKDLPRPTGLDKHMEIAVTVTYTCRDYPTKASSQAQSTTFPPSSQTSATATGRATETTTKKVISTYTSNATATLLTTAVATSIQTTPRHDSGTNPRTKPETSTSSVESTHQHSTDPERQTDAVVIVAAVVPTLLIFLCVVLVIIFYIKRRKHKDDVADDKTAVWPVIKRCVICGSNSGETDNTEHHENPLGILVGRVNNSYTEHNGYSEYTEIEPGTSIRDEPGTRIRDEPGTSIRDEPGEYDTINLQTFKVAADPTYNHIGASLREDEVTDDAHYGEHVKPIVTDDSYDTCGATTFKHSDDTYSHINTAAVDGTTQNQTRIVERSNYDDIGGFRDHVADVAVCEDTYSHIDGATGASRGESIPCEDTYSHIDGTVSTIRRDNNPETSDDSYSHIGHYYKSADDAPKSIIQDLPASAGKTKRSQLNGRQNGTASPVEDGTKLQVSDGENYTYSVVNKIKEKGSQSPDTAAESNTNTPFYHILEKQF